MAGGARCGAEFINAFDAGADRMALVTYGNGAQVVDADAGQPRLRQEPA